MEKQGRSFKSPVTTFEESVSHRPSFLCWLSWPVYFSSERHTHTHTLTQKHTISHTHTHTHLAHTHTSSSSSEKTYFPSLPSLLPECISLQCILLHETQCTAKRFWMQHAALPILG